ncbi:MAG: EpsI family protein [Armatimonadetes bacterium]|nr:EpsI family protein [Armatimonadota bacterium]
MATATDTIERVPQPWGVGLVGVMLAWLAVPVALQLIPRWQEPDASHGPLIPLAAAFFVWQKREALRACPAGRSGWGLLLLTAGALCYALGVLADALFFAAAGLVLIVQGVTLYLIGWSLFKIILFPMLFLFFMIPWPETVLGALSWRLQQASIAGLNAFLGLAGIAPQRDGTVILYRSAGSDPVQMQVAEACSGIHSLIALLAISAVFGYLTAASLWKKVMVFLAGVPLALFSNLARLILVALVGYWLGQDPMMAFHDWSDPFLFFFATCGLLLLKRTLEQSPPAAPESPAPAPVRSPKAAPWLAVIPLSLALGARCLALTPTPAPEKPGLKRMPAVLGAWRHYGPDKEFTDSEKKLLTPDDALLRVYRHSDTGWPVEVAVIFGHRKNTFHDPTFCIQGGGIQIIDHEKVNIDIPKSAVPWNLFRSHNARWKPDGCNALIYFLYLNGDRPTTDLFHMNARLLADRLRYRKASGALVRIVIPTLGRDKAADEIARDFIARFYPELIARLKTI